MLLTNLLPTMDSPKEQRYDSTVGIKVNIFLQITRVVEGIETAIFKQFFVSWNENENASFGFGRYDMMRVEWY